MLKRPEGTRLLDKQALLTSLETDRTPITFTTKRDAAVGNVGAYHFIGEVYLNVREYRKAMSWFMLGARQNEPRCIFMIGYFYEKGLHVKPDFDVAIHWYIKSVTTNYPVTMKHLDNLCRSGNYSKIITKLLTELAQRLERDKMKIEEFNRFYEWRLMEMKERTIELNQMIGGCINSKSLLRTRFKEEDLFSFVKEQNKIKDGMIHLIQQKELLNRDERHILSYEKIIKELGDFVFL